MANIDQRKGTSCCYTARIAQAALYYHVKILMRLIPLVTVTHFTLK